MKATQRLADAGQSIWLDNITRAHLTDGILQRYITEFQVSGLTSNPAIFNSAIKNGHDYDVAIQRAAAEGKSAEASFVDLALEDLTQAADLLRPAYERSIGRDGWVSLEVSPLLAPDVAGTVSAASRLHARGHRSNLFIKIPGTREGLVAIEESIFAGVPINVTLLFSPRQWLAAAEAYMRGVERRTRAGLSAGVASVASLFVSRWDVAVRDRVPQRLRNCLGLAVARRTYAAYRDLLASPRWKALAASGARSQRLLWSSTGAKDPGVPDTLYVEALIAPDSINTMPDRTLLAFADHGKVENMMPVDGGDADEVLARFGDAGVDVDALAEQLQAEGIAAFDRSWEDMMACIASKGERVMKQPFTAAAR